ncbi:MAG: chemotaxis protein CheW [bacterium]|nr:chemotaxis protein CheW [bacterium]
MSLKTARPDAKASNSLLQVIRFKLGDEEFAMDILQVEEIIRMLEITKVPKAPRFVEGVVSLRDRVIPVVDLRKRFDIAPAPENGQTRMIVVKTRPKPIGLIVDSVSEVLRLSKERVEPSPTVISNLDSRPIAGVAKIEGHLIMLLDADLILSNQENTQI